MTLATVAVQAAFSTTVALLIVTGLTGRSCAPVVHRADLLDHGQALGVGRLAEGRVLAVEVRHFFQADEELRAGRVGIAGAGHREHARLVLGGVELGRNRVARPAGAGAFGAAALDHEALDDAVEDQRRRSSRSWPGRACSCTWPGATSGSRSSVILPSARVEHELIFLAFEVEVFGGGFDFGFAVLGHGGSSACCKSEACQYSRLAGHVQ